MNTLATIGRVMYSMDFTRCRAPCVWLSIGIVAAFGFKSIAQESTPAFPERLEAAAEGEGVRGESIKLSGAVVVMFRRGPDSYLTLRPEAVNFLALQPSVRTPPGLRATIRDLDVRPTRVIDGDKVGEGYLVNCAVTITSAANVAPGDYEVIIELSAVSRVAAAIAATSPLVPPKCTYKVKLWESGAVRDQVKERERRMAEEKVANERRLREAALAEKAREERRQALKARSIAGAVLVFVVACVLAWPWMFPKYRVTVIEGNSASISGRFTREKSVENPDATHSPEFISESRQARSFFGRSVDITVTTTATSATSKLKTWENQRYRDGALEATWYTYSVETAYSLIITASVSYGVRSGNYLARTVSGSCRVHVI